MIIMAEIAKGRLFHKVGVLGRFKPLHLGGARMLDAVCQNSKDVVIGIGSCNPELYSARNPFTVEETEAMLRAYLEPRYSNFTIIHVPDFGHIPQYKDGNKWLENTTGLFGKLDAFVTSNPYVTELLKRSYRIVHPASLIPKEQHIYLCATEVRYEIASYQDWKKLVPEEVATYMEKNGLDHRLRKEFGLEILANFKESKSYFAEHDGHPDVVYSREEDIAHEKNNVTGVP